MKYIEELRLLSKFPDVSSLKKTDLINNAQNISGGQFQRVNLIRSILEKPSLLCIDEGTSAWMPIQSRTSCIGSISSCPI